MNKTSKSFLKNAILLTIALVVIALFMREWGAAQIIIVLLVAGLAGMQWFLFFYMKKK
ncbi:MAG: hypothetical protein MSR67_00660 [Oscillospiraceae bacterium]|nr:hypothetical protein [Oscillospiraceae bacterium]